MIGLMLLVSLPWIGFGYVLRMFTEGRSEREFQRAVERYQR